MLKEKILSLKQNVNLVGASPHLDYIKTEFVEKIELESHKDIVFKSAFDKMYRLVDKCAICIEDYESIRELKNAYSEAYMYSKLKSLLVIDKVPEALTKTPDFKVTFAGSPIYVETKALNMADGSFNDRRHMNAALDVKLELEKHTRKDGDFRSGSYSVQSCESSNKPYVLGTTNIIQVLIDKIDNNLKKDQFNLGDTVLLVDICDLLPVPFPQDSIQEVYDRRDGCKVSGVLWHTAFGSVDSLIYEGSEFAGKFVTKQLDREGILNSSPFVKGLIFHINENFYALAKVADQNTRVIDMVRYLCPTTIKLQK